jgi:hypothetical protein
LRWRTTARIAGAGRRDDTREGITRVLEPGSPLSGVNMAERLVGKVVAISATHETGRKTRLNLGMPSLLC